jgi:hypothetical protein
MNAPHWYSEAPRARGGHSPESNLVVFLSALAVLFVLAV